VADEDDVLLAALVPADRWYTEGAIRSTTPAPVRRTPAKRTAR
jgi:hypothetical protein